MLQEEGDQVARLLVRRHRLVGLQARLELVVQSLAHERAASDQFRHLGSQQNNRLTGHGSAYRRRARRVHHQRHLAHIVAGRHIGQNHLAPTERARHHHRAFANQVQAVGLVAFAEQGFSALEMAYLRSFYQGIELRFADVCRHIFADRAAQRHQIELLAHRIDRSEQLDHGAPRRFHQNAALRRTHRGGATAPGDQTEFTKKIACVEQNPRSARVPFGPHDFHLPAHDAEKRVGIVVAFENQLADLGQADVTFEHELAQLQGVHAAHPGHVAAHQRQHVFDRLEFFRGSDHRGKLLLQQGLIGRHHLAPADRLNCFVTLVHRLLD